MGRLLEEEGHKSVGSTVVYAPCHELDVKRHFRKHKGQSAKADAVVVMSCGAGVQAVVEATDLPVYPTSDSLFLGNAQRHMHFEEKCSTCGECVLDKFREIQPPKNYAAIKRPGLIRSEE